MQFTQQDTVSSASRTAARGVHRRDMVLRILTDLFVVDGERQSEAQRKTNEDLMINLARESGSVIRREVAERLACHANPPRRLVRMLAADEIAVAAPLLRHSRALSDADLALIVLTGSVEHGRAVALRPALGAAVTDAIIAIEDAQAVSAMMRNPYAVLSEDGIRQLCRDGGDMAATVDALMTREHLQPEVMAGLFWHTAGANREVILARLTLRDAQAAWPDGLPRLNGALRSAGAADLQAAQEGLCKILLARRVDAFRDLFARALGVKPALGERIMQDEGGEAFAVACRAAGFSAEAFTSMLILYNPVVGKSVERVFAIGGAYDGIPRALAWRLLEAWNEKARDGDREREPAAARAEAPLRGAIHEAYAVRTERSAATYAAARGRPRPDAALPRPGQRSTGGSGR